MSIGHFLLAVELLFFPALLFLILGNGTFKPNISTQVASLCLQEILCPGTQNGASCATRPDIEYPGHPPILRETLKKNQHVAVFTTAGITN
jgi:hypothetical protein